MKNNIARNDLDAVIEFLRQDDPMLTQFRNVQLFEEEWSRWLGLKYSVFVNSGSSANLASMWAIRHRFGAGGEVIVPTLTWVSDIASVIHCGFTPVFVDICPDTLGMDPDEVLRKITGNTKAVFLTHVLGYNALTQDLFSALAERGIPLIEDVCESYGATFDGRKLGTFGLMSNFSFYYAHHMTTIEGGMISTNDEGLYEILRMIRAHGMVRESTSRKLREGYAERHIDLHPDFIFALPGFNMRSTEIQAIIGLSQLKRLDDNNLLRVRNFKAFIGGLDPKRYFTEFRMDGSCNYAFTLVLRHPDDELRANVMIALNNAGVEVRIGTAGGGNQLRQPYLKAIVGNEFENYPRVDHVHFYGFYIGNYPGLEEHAIRELCSLLNAQQGSFDY